MPGIKKKRSNIKNVLDNDDFVKTLTESTPGLLFPHLGKLQKYKPTDSARGSGDLFLQVSKKFFNIGKHLKHKRKDDRKFDLDSLLIDPEFSMGQIWQQLELFNKSMTLGLYKTVKKAYNSPDLESELENDELEDEQFELNDKESQDDEYESMQNELSSVVDENEPIAQSDKDTPINDGEEYGQESKSSTEKEKEKLAKRISDLEKEIMDDKHWTLRGEVSTNSRPINSLLEENLEVDVSLKPSPVITEETTKSLEDIIKQRIVDEQYDDVERKVDVSSLLFNKFDPDKDAEIDSEKSKVSLAQVYEDQFLKETGQAGPSAKSKEVEKAHKSIGDLFSKLCHQLDALSNYHYVPKPATASLEVVTDGVAAIKMEEVLPVYVSEAQTLAPQQVFAPVKENVAVRQELTKDEKKRARVKARKEKSKNYQRKQEQKELYKKIYDKQQLSVTETKKFEKQVVKDDKEQALKLLSKQSNVKILQSKK